jgi:anti-sigma factor RsiW
MDCPEIENLLLERAAGPLEPEIEAVVAGHLARCEPCRREAAAAEEALGLAALPPPSAEERAALSPLVENTRAALRQSELRRARLRLAGAALVAAAAAALLVLAPSAGRARRAAPLAADASEESTSDLEAWALADPFTEELGEEPEPSEEAGDLGPSDSDLRADDDLYLDPGEPLP